MSASPCILITGVTGFIGGTVVSVLYEKHPDFHIKALIRQESVAEELKSVYPKLDTVVGELSSLPLLTSLASDANFIIHTGGDNVPAVCAMIDGLASRRMPRSPLPRLISLTGARSLIDLSKPVTGSLDKNSRPWSDVTDAEAILNLSEDRIHAGADKAIIAHSVAKSIGTVLVSPTQLWGRGKGHLKRESNSAIYYSAIVGRGRAFVVGDGTATWSWVSIGDLGDAIVFLMELSLRDGGEGSKQIGVNQNGYYFVSTGDLSMAERAEAVNERLGFERVDSISAEEAKKIHPMGHIMWGCGERTRADKLAELGWKPKEMNWKALMEEEGGNRA